MSGAPQIELHEEQSPCRTARADLHGLLREVHAARISNLSSLRNRGVVLLREGEPAQGVYILLSGRATVSISSSEGRIVMLRTARPGDVLGLNSVLRDCVQETTITTLEPCRTDFISRAELLELMAQSPAATHAVLRLLSKELSELSERTRSLLLPQTASAKLAKLLLEWSRDGHSDSPHGIRLDKLFTHEEIAQMICASRETVTRLLALLSKRQIIQVSSDSILIRDLPALERTAIA